METAGIDCLDFGRLDTIDVRGTGVEIFRAGEGAPLLFLHGIDGLEGAPDLLRELAKSFEVHAPSLPGFGASDLPDGIDRIDDVAYLYLDLLDTLDLDAPAILGTSIGAWAACEMLTKEPGRARSLILASPLGLKTSDKREHWVADIFMMPKQELAQRLQYAPPEGPSLFEMAEGPMRRALRADEALSVYGWTPYMCNPKLGARLHRVTCPAMVIWGDRDAIIDPHYRHLWRDSLPDAAVEILADAGHRSHADKPVELAASVGRFIAGAA